MTQAKEPSQVVTGLRRSIKEAGGSRRVRFSELPDLFGSQEWSPQLRQMVAARLAVQGIEARPPVEEAGLDDWVELSLPEPRYVRLGASDYPAEPGGYSGPTAIEVVVLASTLGPLVTAFCTELGKRLGGTVADWASRVHARRGEDPGLADIVIDDGKTVTSLRITGRLTDEAKLAILDLNINDQELRGHELRWNEPDKAWIAVSGRRRRSVRVWRRRRNRARHTD